MTENRRQLIVDIAHPDASLDARRLAAQRRHAAALVEVEAAGAELFALAAEVTPARPPAGSPAVMSIDETADRLRIGRSTVFELIKSGDLPSVKIGSRRLVRPADADAFVAARVEVPT